MAIHLISARCPVCGATLNVDSDQKQTLCEYCGTKLLIQEENGLKKTEVNEAEKVQKEKQIELAKKRRKEFEKRRAIKTKVSITLLSLSILMLIMVCLSSETNSSVGIVMAIAGFCSFFGFIISIAVPGKMDHHSGEICMIPSVVSDYEKRNYTSVEEIFKCAGFSNVKCVPINDLKFGLVCKPNMVESITINGKRVTNGGTKCYSDALVVISYHSFPKKVKN